MLTMKAARDLRVTITEADRRKHGMPGPMSNHAARFVLPPPLRCP